MHRLYVRVVCTPEVLGSNIACLWLSSKCKLLPSRSAKSSDDSAHPSLVSGVSNLQLPHGAQELASISHGAPYMLSTDSLGDLSGMLCETLQFRRPTIS